MIGNYCCVGKILFFHTVVVRKSALTCVIIIHLSIEFRSPDESSLHHLHLHRLHLFLHAVELGLVNMREDVISWTTLRHLSIWIKWEGLQKPHHYQSYYTVIYITKSKTVWNGFSKKTVMLSVTLICVCMCRHMLLLLEAWIFETSSTSLDMLDLMKPLG